MAYYPRPGCLMNIAPGERPVLANLYIRCTLCVHRFSLKYPSKALILPKFHMYYGQPFSNKISKLKKNYNTDCLRNYVYWQTPRLITRNSNTPIQTKICNTCDTMGVLNTSMVIRKHI
jgi:hypothetical protein